MGAAVAIEPARFAAMYDDPAVFEHALAKESVAPPAGHRVTGITVPHHLVAADLIARGFRCASYGSPTSGSFSFRPIISGGRGCRLRRRAERSRRFSAMSRATKVLSTRFLSACPKVAESALFAKEHGVHAVLPFVARFFPKAKIVPIALRIDSKREDWLALVDALAPLVDSKTLVVQSTDFSHYLDHGKARRRDQQTMNTLALGDPEAVARLRQPDAPRLEGCAVRPDGLAAATSQREARCDRQPELTGLHTISSAANHKLHRPGLRAGRPAAGLLATRTREKQCGFSRVTRFSAGV